ncbi:hypothetical protein OIU85_003310 [Salix viminalis]|uniref:O-acyltransferase WSD1 C-terminal domain-containing protein n=1 Tax=Salix viminalis TaxID=40686 RepID=A0A9Q0PZC7_SALVM|nr:hypothetical protein OIU85_003310 [Salix viminalis]
MKSSSDVKLGNLIGYVLFPFTIALREDALDYVRSAKATGKRKKATLEAIYTYFMAKTFNKFFGPKKKSLVLAIKCPTLLLLAMGNLM